MKIDEILESLRTEYIEICPTCSLETKVLTQKNYYPEYETEIYIQCNCGEYLEFILPVN